MNSEEPLYSIDFEVTEDDILEYLKHSIPPTLNKVGLTLFFSGLLIPFVIIILEMTLYKGITWLLIAALCWMLLFRYVLHSIMQILERLAIMKAAKAMKGKKVGKYKLRCTPSGIMVQSECGETSMSWGEIDYIHETAYQVVFIPEQKEEFVVPDRFFLNREQYDEFINIIRRYHEMAVIQSPLKKGKRFRVIRKMEKDCARDLL